MIIFLDFFSEHLVSQIKAILDLVAIRDRARNSCVRGPPAPRQFHDKIFIVVLETAHSSSPYFFFLACDSWLESEIAALCSEREMSVSQLFRVIDLLMLFCGIDIRLYVLVPDSCTMLSSFSWAGGMR